MLENEHLGEDIDDSRFEVLDTALWKNMGLLLQASDLNDGTIEGNQRFQAGIDSFFNALLQDIQDLQKLKDLEQGAQ